jgi:hypothetical protein
LFFQSRIETVELKLPGTIKVYPGSSLEIGTGMFGQRDFLGMHIHTQQDDGKNLGSCKLDSVHYQSFILQQ